MYIQAELRNPLVTLVELGTGGLSFPGILSWQGLSEDSYQI